jgi:MYXO-CTERM domain-containing protein
LLVSKRMSRIIAASLIALAAPASAAPVDSGSSTRVQPDASYVIGGTAVPPGKWPDTVAVLGQGACTGTLIAPDVVLTAGHCADMNPTTVIANTTDYQGQGGTRATVKSVTAYPNWETSFDVSVIVLQQPLTGITPRKVGTGCTFDEGFSDGTMVRLVGFGLTDTAGQGNNTKLNETMSPVTDSDCSGPGGCSQGAKPAGEFIAGGSGQDSCFGDSGGPVYLETPRGVVVIGAVSRGLEGSATPCGGGGIYVRTDKIVEWIEQTAGKPVEKDLCAAGPGGEDPGGEDPGNEDPGGEGPNGGGGVDDITGGCSSSTGGSSALLVLLGLAFVRRRSRK